MRNIGKEIHTSAFLSIMLYTSSEIIGELLPVFGLTQLYKSVIASANIEQYYWKKNVIRQRSSLKKKKKQTNYNV